VKNKDREGSDSSDGIFPNLTGRDSDSGLYEVLGSAPAGERCAVCGKGSGVKWIEHGGEVGLWDEDCGRGHLASMADPSIKLADLGPEPLDEHGALLAGHTSPSTNGQPALSSYIIHELANWYEAAHCRVGLDLDQDTLDRDLRRLLAQQGVSPEFIPVEFERVMRAMFIARADELRVEHIAAQLEEAEQQRLTDDWLEEQEAPRRRRSAWRRQRRRPPMTKLPEPSDYVQRKAWVMSQSILDACVQHFETGTYDDNLVAAFHALRDAMIFLMSRLSPAEQREIVLTLQKDSHGWPALAEEINARDSERFGWH
jgi:hypothetical protein